MSRDLAADWASWAASQILSLPRAKVNAIAVTAAGQEQLGGMEWSVRIRTAGVQDSNNGRFPAGGVQLVALLDHSPEGGPPDDWLATGHDLIDHRHHHCRQVQ